MLALRWCCLEFNGKAYAVLIDLGAGVTSRSEAEASGV